MASVVVLHYLRAVFCWTIKKISDPIRGYVFIYEMKMKIKVELILSSAWMHILVFDVFWILFSIV